MNARRTRAKATERVGPVRRFARRIVRGLLGLLLLGALLVISLRWIDPPVSMVILADRLEAWRSGAAQPVQRWVDLDAMDKALAIAVVAAEDQRFPNHHGIDVIELRKAIRGGGRRGASTISQQVAKNLFLWQGRSYLRKAIEAPLAVFLDIAWGKRRVLEVYLNIAYFGDNVYGAEAASRHYFNKSAANLNRFEAARLAAVLPNPERFSADHASRYTVERQQWILGQMKQLGGAGYLDFL